jgi:cobalt transporter subunit CbtB
MSSISLSTAASTGLSIARAEALESAFVALFPGFGLVYLAVFSAHDAAHAARRAQAFPCD